MRALLTLLLITSLLAGVAGVAPRPGIISQRTVAVRGHLGLRCVRMSATHLMLGIRNRAGAIERIPRPKYRPQRTVRKVEECFT